MVEEQIRREAVDRRDNHRRQPPLRPSVLFPYVPAGQSRKGAYRGRLVERGRYRFGPVRLSTRFPFGLFSRTITRGRSRNADRAAAAGPADPTAGRRGGSRRSPAPIAAGSGPGREGDFYGVREWRSGDGRRLIHWRSSARLGKLVVRQFERPRSRDVAVVLDLWQPEPTAAEHGENVELAVSFAATVLADLCRKGGSNVYLGIEQRRAGVLGGPASPATLQGLMEQLAWSRLAADDPLPALLADALRRIAAGTEIVLVSTRPVDLADTARFAALWSDPVLRERARRIAVVDTSSEQLAEYFHESGRMTNAMRRNSRRIDGGCTSVSAVNAWLELAFDLTVIVISTLQSLIPNP